MNTRESSAKGRVIVTYDAHQHCTAERRDLGRAVAMDCPYTGRGEELSPNNLIAASLAGCMFLSMGTLAQRDKLDISGAWMEVDVTPGERHILAIDVMCHMPPRFSDRDQLKLERAAALCPVKSSFRTDIPVTVRYQYEEVRQ